MFRKQHYEFLARFLAHELEVESTQLGSQQQSRRKTLEGVARLLASELQRDNPKFDRNKFLKALGVEE